MFDNLAYSINKSDSEAAIGI